MSSLKADTRAASPGLTTRETKLLLEMSRVFSSEVSQEEMTGKFAALLQQVIPFDRAVVNNIDWDAGVCTDFCLIGFDVPGKPRDVPTPLAGTLTLRVATEKRGRLVQGLTHEEVARDWPALDMPYRHGLRSFLGAPLMLRGEAIGMIGLQAVKENAFSERHLWLCEQLAFQIAGTVSHSRLLEQARRESEERSALMQIGRLVDEAPDLYSTFSGVHSELQKLLRFDRIVFAIVDPETMVSRQAYVRGVAVPGLEENSIIHMERAFASDHVGERGAILGLSGLPPLEVAPEIEDAVAASGLKSIAAATLFASERVIGIISVRSSQENFYSEEDHALLAHVAQQIAPAIENVRLREEARALAERNYALARIGRIINSSRHIEEIYDQFASEVRLLLPCDHIAISLADVDNGTLRDVYESGVITPADEPGAVRSLAGTSTEQVISEGTPLIINSPNPDEFARQFMRISQNLAPGSRICSGLSVPLTHQSKTFGVLHLRSQQPNAYSIIHAELALSVAAQVAGAVANADLLSRLEQEGKERAALADISRIFSSNFDVTSTSGPFAEVLKRIVPFDRLALKTVDSKAGTLTDVVIVGAAMEQDNPGVPYAIAGTLSESVTMQRRSMRVPVGPGEGQGNGMQIAPPVAEAGFRSLMNVPLVFDDQVVGVLAVRSRQEFAYTAEHERFMERVAYQIAGAVMNAGLVAQLEQEAKERATLAEIGKIFSSTLAIEKACPPFGDVLKRIVPFDRVVIKSLNHSAGTLTDLCIIGEATPNDRPGSPHPIKHLISRAVVAERRPICLPARDDDEASKQIEAASPGLMQDFASLLNVPLIFDEHVIGMITLWSHQNSAYAAAHERFMERVASQISGALVNFDLYNRIERKAEEETALAMLSRSASVLLDIDEIIVRSTGIVSALVPAEHIAVNIVNSDGRTFHGRIMKGSLFWSADNPAASPLKGSVTAAAVRTGKTLWLTKEYEQGSHPDFDAVRELAKSGVRSSITVPLIVEQNVIGTLVFISTRSNAFTNGDVSLSERIASHLARALANAELHSRAVRLAEEEALRAKLEVDNEKLRVANEIKGHLLSNVSHELRTPLTSVLSFAYTLRRNPQGNLTELQLKQLDMIRRGGRILEMLISDLLAMSNMEAGKFKINRDEFVLGDLVYDVQAVVESLINTRGQVLKVGVNTPDAVVFGDRDRLAQVLFNLLNNASRYSDDGSTVWLKARLEGDNLVVSVKDQGIGITQEEQASLFTRFFRADNESTRIVSGTGLGLYISRSIVEMHGGLIWVESEPGVGSEFSFRIPARATEQQLEKSA